MKRTQSNTTHKCIEMRSEYNVDYISGRTRVLKCMLYNWEVVTDKAFCPMKHIMRLSTRHSRIYEVIPILNEMFQECTDIDERQKGCKHCNSKCERDRHDENLHRLLMGSLSTHKIHSSML